MSLSPLFLLIAMILFGVEAVRSKSLLAAGLAFMDAAFVVDAGVIG